MAIKPILFNTEMVKAILAGNKTMTRRLIKDGCQHYDANGALYHVGDILWVRETWMPETEQGIPAGSYIYKATDKLTMGKPKIRFLPSRFFGRRTREPSSPRRTLRS